MLRSLFPPLKFDWKVVTVTVASALLLMVDFYHQFAPRKEVDRTVLYFLIPLFFILVVFRERPRDFGFTLGDWRAGLVITLASLVVMTPVIWFLGRGDASMQSYYSGLAGNLPWTVLELFGWEFFFRGWILFTYARRFGPEAMWLQAVPFALAHIGKPEVETLSTIFGGFAFGWIAWRTKSFLYPFLIHAYIYTLVIFRASGLLG